MSLPYDIPTLFELVGSRPILRDRTSTEYRDNTKKKKNVNNVSTTSTSATSKFEYNIYNVAMDIMIIKLQQRFAKHSELSADFACLDPRNFLKELPVTAFVKLSKLLGFEKTVLQDELKDFDSEWEKFKFKFPKTYLVQEEDNEDDGEEGEITLNNENQQQKIEQCKEK